MWRSVAANGMSFLILALIALAGAIAWGQREFRAQGPLTDAVFFEVPRGASLRRVSEDLEAAGIVTSAMLFRLGADYAEMSGALRFGNYEIPPGASMEQVLAIVTTGGPASFRYTATYVLRLEGTGELRLRERVPGTDEVVALADFAYEDGVPEVYSALVADGTPIAYRVSVPEGLTSWQIVEGLRAADFLSGEIAEVPPEGVLAPDTFEVRRGQDRQEIIDKMLATQQDILVAAWAGRQDGLPLADAQEALILASIIEKETSVAEERRLVSSVFINRLNQGIRLQTDPTVIYGLTEGRGVLGRGIRASELRAETPWNTYVIDGMPPTPIANPRRAAIEAAVNPEDTPLIFFVADGTGGHAFAETLEEHNRNVARWRQIEAEREAAGQ